MRKLPEKPPVFTPYQMFKDREATNRVVAYFYQHLGEANADQVVFTDKEEKAACGFLNLTWDITANAPSGVDRRSVLTEVGERGVSSFFERHYGDQARSLGSHLVRTYGTSKVARAAAEALVKAGVGQVIAAK